jgi:hypothetical protein
MKKALVIAMMFFSVATFAQKLKSGDVPKVVKEKFVALYPGVMAKWEKEKANYEAGFKKDGKTMSVLIDAFGNLVETETDIRISELPKTVSDYIAKKFPGQAVKEAAKIVDSKGVMKYEAEVKGKDYLFDVNGNPLN